MKTKEKTIQMNRARREKMSRISSLGIYSGRILSFRDYPPSYSRQAARFVTA